MLKQFSDEDLLNDARAYLHSRLRTGMLNDIDLELLEFFIKPVLFPHYVPDSPFASLSQHKLDKSSELHRKEGDSNAD